MALDGTYAGLQASVGDFLNRSDLLGVVPDFIALAETQINRRLRAADMVVSTTLTVNGPSNALPGDFNGVISFELPAGNPPVAYEKPDGVRALRQLYPSTGTPFKWSILGSNLEVVPAPSQSFACPLAYYGRLPALSAGNTTNWLLAKHPDCYLYGALVQSAPYLKDDPRLQVWGDLFEQALEDIQASDGRVSFGHGLTPPFRNAAYPEGTAAQPAPPPAAPGGQ